MFHRLGLLPEDRIEFVIAQLCALVANAFRKEGSRAASPDDFMPRFDHQAKRQTPEEMGTILQSSVVVARGARKQRRARSSPTSAH